jgi:hypothetical protein
MQAPKGKYGWARLNPGGAIVGFMECAWLDTERRCSQYQRMAYTFLVFDFGNNEDVAQQARHKVDAWRQGFRLDKKLQLKFDRKDPASNQEGAPASTNIAEKETPKSRGKSKAKSRSEGEGANSATSVAAASPQVRLIVRLDFSDHEKLSHQRWLDRIPEEEPFKSAMSKIVRASDSEHKATKEFYDLLD